MTSRTPKSGRPRDTRPVSASSASDARLSAATSVRSRLTAAGRRCINAETVHAADQTPDHSVIELIEHSEEPGPARILRQAAEYLAQRLGVRRQQRPDHRGGAVPQNELAGQPLTGPFSPRAYAVPQHSVWSSIHAYTLLNCYGLPVLAGVPGGRVGLRGLLEGGAVLVMPAAAVT